MSRNKNQDLRWTPYAIFMRTAGHFRDETFYTQKVIESLGKVITGIRVGDGGMVIELEDKTTLDVSDHGQNCCESRYMTCDDDLQYHVGAMLNGLEIAGSEDRSNSNYGDCHDIEFLCIHTTKGTITVANHNEHNGYYGGFNVTCT